MIFQSAQFPRSLPSPFPMATLVCLTVPYPMTSRRVLGCAVVNGNMCDRLRCFQWQHVICLATPFSIATRHLVGCAVDNGNTCDWLRRFQWQHVVCLATPLSIATRRLLGCARYPMATRYLLGCAISNGNTYSWSITGADYLDACVFPQRVPLQSRRHGNKKNTPRQVHICEMLSRLVRGISI